jgi:hypothetical protein
MGAMLSHSSSPKISQEPDDFSRERKGEEDRSGDHSRVATRSHGAIIPESSKASSHDWSRFGRHLEHRVDAEPFTQSSQSTVVSVAHRGRKGYTDAEIDSERPPGRRRILHEMEEHKLHMSSTQFKLFIVYRVLSMTLLVDLCFCSRNL